MKHAPAATHEGRVVAGHGRTVVVEARGTTHACHLFGRRLEVVCGDRVRWAPGGGPDEPGIVTEVLQRSTALSRTNARAESELIVANLTQLVAVVAPLPVADLALCDRYLAAAAWAGLEAAIVLNKADLPEAGALRTALADYVRLGYRVVAASKRGPPGAAELAPLLAGHVSVLVGQSGVGKSSLLNLLVPGAAVAVQEVSRATDEGRHTTTAATLHHLPGGGDVVDSPGVRDFAPPLPAPRDIGLGFREIAALAPRCRFPDCLHDGEPGCAVAAPASGVDERRLSSYRRLVRLARDFERKRVDSGRGRETPRPKGPRLR